MKKIADTKIPGYVWTGLLQSVNNFALEPYSKLCSFPNFFVNPNVCQISMRLEEANCAWNN